MTAILDDVIFYAALAVSTIIIAAGIHLQLLILRDKDSGLYVAGSVAITLLAGLLLWLGVFAYLGPGAALQ